MTGGRKEIFIFIFFLKKDEYGTMRCINVFVADLCSE